MNEETRWMNFLCGGILPGLTEHCVCVFSAKMIPPDSLDMPLPAIEDGEKADSC